ncbi:MAG TPA: RNase H family protein [Pirellulaceae bacterium]|jgi:ribonuclease HI
MSVRAPHFLLYAEAATRADSAACDAGRWRFVLQLPSGETSLEAADEEHDATPERLELLAVIRGLEALSQPSRVTLLSGSRSIRRGLEHGLSQWRENDWQWERYGRLAPVKNGDLWQRLDRLLDFHALECRPTRLDKADDLAAPPPRPQQVEAPQRRRGGGTFRIDKPHTAAKHQITSTKSQTNSKFKKRNARNVAGRLGLWNFLVSRLFGHWSLVIGHLRSGRSR